MAKKGQRTRQPDTSVFLTLPGEGGLQREAVLIVRRGDVGVTRLFRYQTIADIAHELDAALSRIVEVAAHPPAIAADGPWQEYRPGTEEKYRRLATSAVLRAVDGAEGRVLAVPDDASGHFLLDVGQRIPVFYRVEDLFTIAAPTPNDRPAPARHTLPERRPATDISPMGERDAQLTLF